jgi:hypothetical protein
MIDSFNRVNKVDYAKLNSKQQEQHLFQKFSAILADYGYATIKLSDDWEGADFIAISQVTGEFFKIQLKGRFTIATKYGGKNVYIAFPMNLSLGQWCIFPHDVILDLLRITGMYVNTPGWEKNGEFHTFKVSNNLRPLLEKYLIS